MPRVLEDGQEVAFKCLKEEILQEDGVNVDRFTREVQVGLRLEHPNIVRILDVGRMDGQPYLAMELIQGQTLERLFRTRGPDALMASKGYPDIEAPEPCEILAGAGDLLLSHYLLAHNAGGNTSDTVRQTVYFRVKRSDHAANWRERIQDPLLDFDALRGVST